jgi:short-subunit dehydrogenase
MIAPILFRELVAVVTGASSGIGAAIARDLAARGTRVALLARRIHRLEALAGEIAAAGGEAFPVRCDVADRAAVAGAVRAVIDRHGGVDVLVNCAGYGRHGLFVDHPVEDVERMTRTNWLGTVYAVKAVLPAMRTQGRGWIVNVASIAGRLAQPDEAAYSATKFAVAGLSEALAYELEPLGIRVLAVFPGLVRTEMITPAVLARLPARVAETAIEPAVVSRAVLRALERGRREATVPGWMRVAYLVRALLPGLHHRLTARVRLPVLGDLRAGPAPP